MAKSSGSGKKPVDKTKQAEKRARREERKAAEARDRKAAATRKRIRVGVGVGLGILLVATAGFFIVQKAIPEELPDVAQPSNDGRGHVANNETVAYQTASPTSGTHAAGAARCGVFDQQLPPEFAVHALEHGTVVIWYQPGLDGEVIDELETLVDRFDDRVVLSPNAELDGAVVATAWNRLKTYSGADPEIADFIDTYRNRGPESVRCSY
ncbi:MAG: DUF3105 domain-containing protein [Actinomycetia bacterium]|nr:DUF3105 domain-containing protein [Actinomycetes bacterium]